MARSNWVIQELLKKGKSTTLSDIEKRSLGEAYFTRGWAHFLIAYRYGLDTQGVPLSVMKILKVAMTILFLLSKLRSSIIIN